MHIILNPITGKENLKFGIYRRNHPLAEAAYFAEYPTREGAYARVRELVNEDPTRNIVVEDHIKTNTPGEPTDVFIFYPGLTAA